MQFSTPALRYVCLYQLIMFFPTLRLLAPRPYIYSGYHCICCRNPSKIFLLLLLLQYVLPVRVSFLFPKVFSRYRLLQVSLEYFR